METQGQKRAPSADWHFASGAALITISNVAVRLLGLAAMPLLTHLLDPKSYGLASLVTTAISLITVIALAGADVSYIRASQDSMYDPKIVETIAWRFALLTSAIASAIGSLCWLVVSRSIGLPPGDFIFILLGIPVSLVSTMVIARARLREQHFRLALTIAVSGALGVTASLLAAWSGRTDETPLLLNLLVVFLVPILMLGGLPLREIFSPVRVELQEYKGILGIGIAIIYTAPAYWVMSSSDRWFLQYFGGTESVGIYSLAVSIGLSGLALNSAILNIWAPEATRLVMANSDDKLRDIAVSLTVALALAWLVVSAMGGDVLKLLAAREFHAGANIIPMLAGGVFFHGMTHLANGLYVTEKRVHHTVIWWLGGMVAIVTLDILLIPSMGIKGAAFAHVLGFAMVAVGMLGQGGRRLLPYLLRPRCLTVLLGILFVAPAMIVQWGMSPLVSLLTKIPAGLCVAIFAAWRLGWAQIVARKFLQSVCED